MKLLRTDSHIALVIGAIGGLFLQPVLTNVLPGIGIVLRVVLFLICLLGSPVGLALLTSIFPSYRRFFKFALVGTLNTAIDLGILNFLLTTFGQEQAYLFPIYATIGFLAATLNSFFWNKYWAFNDRPVHGGAPVIWFYIVSIVGFFVNVGLATGLVRLGAPPGLTLLIWENIAKVAGIAASLITNFVGYKYVVFRSPENHR